MSGDDWNFGLRSAGESEADLPEIREPALANQTNLSFHTAQSCVVMRRRKIPPILRGLIMAVKWNDSTYGEICEKYPALQEKSEAVALAVLAYEDNPEIGSEGFKELSEKTGVNVAGRAVGSARAVLGLPPLTKKPAGRGRKGSGKKRGRPAKSAAAGEVSLSGISAALQTLQQIERDNTKTRRALEKIRELCDTALTT